MSRPDPLRYYIIRRILLVIPVLLGVSIIVFALLLFFSPEQRATVFVTDIRQLRDIQAIITRHGLDKPVYVQYFRWLGQVFQGNLGWSKTAQRPVLQAFFYFLPPTAELAIFSTPLIIILGMKLGSLSARYKDKPVDHISRFFSIIGWSLPTFWLGLILLMVFYGYFSGLLPPGELGIESSLIVKSTGFTRYTHINVIDALLNRRLWIFLDALRHLILPVITLVIVNCALVARIMRSSMLEVLSKDYILSARAKGADERTVIKKHARRNAMIPVLTISGYIFALLMSGMVITETIFNRKGLGWWWANAATQLDIPAVLGAVLFNGVLLVGTNLIIDLLYAYFDPRIRLR